jgi:uncharacterized ferritin-like protein (DUF455 family)
MAERPLGPADVAAALGEICFLQRSLAHIESGWLVKAPRFADKVALAEQWLRDLEHAAQSHGRWNALTRLAPSAIEVPSRWLEILEGPSGIDRAADADALLDGLHGGVRAYLVDRCRKLAGATDPILDAATVRLLETAIADEEATLRAASRSAPAVRGALEESAGSVERIAFVQPWPPLDRVPEAPRLPSLPRPIPGAMAPIPVDDLDDARGIAEFLHSSICEEYTTLELLGRNSYEHPEMPFAFHLDMARQAADEARHAAGLTDALGDYGLRYGERPVFTISYDTLYQFAGCKAGSRRELLWRILLRQTFHEGLALDSLAQEVRRRRETGQTRLSDLFGFIFADEVLHAANGLRWSRYLCDGDPAAAMRERALAHDEFTATLKRRRSDFVRRHPELAAEELRLVDEREANAGGRVHKERILDRASRRAAGFRDDEIAQVLAWGYVKEVAPDVEGQSLITHAECPSCGNVFIVLGDSPWVTCSRCGHSFRKG